MSNIIRYDDVEGPIYQFALQAYKYNAKYSQIDMDEFQEEYQRYWFVLKLLAIYRNRNEINVRLLLNHLVVLTNNFGQEASQILLKLSIEKADYDILSYVLTILTIIGFVPDNRLISILGEDYLLEDIPLDKKLEDTILQEIQ